MAEPVGDLLLKLTVGGLVVLVFVSIAPSILGTFGLAPGIGMEPITYILMFGLFPVAFVFIVLYGIFSYFARRT